MLPIRNINIFLLVNDKIIVWQDKYDLYQELLMSIEPITLKKDNEVVFLCYLFIYFFMRRVIYVTTSRNKIFNFQSSYRICIQEVYCL